jgi:membrane protease YdiL (CAAX protease family)
MGTPVLASIIAWRIEGGRRSKLREVIGFSFNMGWPNAIFACYVFPAISLACLGFTILLPWFSYDPTMSDLIARFAKNLTSAQIEEMRRSMDSFPIPPVAMLLIQGLIGGATVNAVAAYGEEAGWRGYLTRQLAGSNFWAASGFIGIVWGLWHAPLIIQGHNYPEHPLIGVFMMTAWCVLLSPIMLFIRLKSKSALAAALAHGTLNGTAAIALLGVKGGDDLTVGVTGLCGFAVLGAAILTIWLVDRRSKNPVMGKKILESETPRPAG